MSFLCFQFYWYNRVIFTEVAYQCFSNCGGGLCVSWLSLLGCHGERRGNIVEKGKPQRAHYSSLVCHHLAPMQCRVGQWSTYFTPGKPSGPSVPHLPGLPSPQEEAAASAVESPPLSCRLVGAQPPPGVLHMAQGQEEKRDNCMGKDAVCWPWGCLTIGLSNLLS